MCEFVSWLEVQRDGKKHILSLDDQELFSERNREILKNSKDNDFLGHHAIRAVYGLKKDEGNEGEKKSFWLTDHLPEELRPKSKDFPSFKRNFGRMVSEYAQEDDLEYIITSAPEDKKWLGLKEFCEEILSARIAKRLPGLLKTVTLEELPYTARYDKTINELVKMAGFKGFIDPNISDRNFKEDVKPFKKRKAVLLCVHRSANIQEVKAIIKHLKLTPGNIKDLISFSIDHPDKQRESPIVEVRSSWRSPYGRWGVAYLLGWRGERDLGLRWRGGQWDGRCRFFALSEV
ncbi:MAG: hypothetical protein AAB885_01390 [Patescibacteria group bacterium]